MRRLGHPLLVVLIVVGVVDFERKVSFGKKGFVETVPGRKFGVGGHRGARDVVSHERGVGVDVEQFDHIALTDDSSSTGFGDLLGRLNDPVIIRVVERVSSDLLT